MSDGLASRRLRNGRCVPICRNWPPVLPIGPKCRFSLSAFPIQAITPAMPPIISVSNLSKAYGSGFKALNHVNLEIRSGEIFALLGPNGAGKTTLISIICGIANLSEGRVTVGGHDINREYRAARSMIGLVPQELP